MKTDVLWFCAGHGNVGIVKVNNPYDGIKYYIGACSGLGANEESDIAHIVSWGSSFPKSAGDLLFFTIWS
jgi:hypothetical protein